MCHVCRVGDSAAQAHRVIRGLTQELLRARNVAQREAVQVRIDAVKADWWAANVADFASDTTQEQRIKDFWECYNKRKGVASCD